MKVGGIERVLKLLAGYVDARGSTKEFFFVSMMDYAMITHC